MQMMTTMTTTSTIQTMTIRWRMITRGTHIAMDTRSKLVPTAIEAHDRICCFSLSKIHQSHSGARWARKYWV